MPQQQERDGRMIVLAVVGFVAICGLLGVLFMMHKDPEGWWKTVKEAVLGGDMSENTVKGGGLESPGRD
jgi:hypothetical protein